MDGIVELARACGCRFEYQPSHANKKEAALLPGLKAGVSAPSI